MRSLSSSKVSSVIVVVIGHCGRETGVGGPAAEQLTQTLQQSIQQDGGLVTDDGTTFQVNEESNVFQGVYSSDDPH